MAALILAELGIAPDPQTGDEYDYFRQARAQRMPAGLWEKIMPIMQLTRPRMVQLLNILQLPTALLELADRYRLPERVLREVLALPRDQLGAHAAHRHPGTAHLRPGGRDGRAPGPEPRRARPRTPAAAALYPGRVATSGLRRFANAIVGAG